MAENGLTLSGTLPAPAIIPYNAEAEMALIGAILINNHAYNTVCDFLKPEHFYDPVHERIYAACAKLIEAGTPADPTTLRHLFENDPQFAEYGGVQYVVRLARASVTIVNAPHYGAILVELAARREALCALDELRTGIEQPDHKTDVYELAAGVSMRLEAIAGAKPTRQAAATAGDATAAAVARMDEVYKADGAIIGIRSGVADLDRAIGGFLPKRFYVLAGKTGMGKSALLLGIMRRAALDGQPGLLITREMPREEIGARLIAFDTGIPAERQITGYPKLTMGDIELATVAAQQMKQWPLIIDDETATMAGIRRKAIEAKRRGQLSILGVDYIQLVGGDGNFQNRTLEVQHITRGLKKLCMELAVPVIGLSQLRRNEADKEERRPNLGDLRESGSLEQDADIVIFCHREAYFLKQPQLRATEDAIEFQNRMADWKVKLGRIGDRSELIIDKNRFGRTRTVLARWNGPSMQYQDAPAGSMDDEADRLI